MLTLVTAEHRRREERVPLARSLVALLLGVALLGGCAQEAPPPPTVEVVVEEVALEPYQPKYQFVGRLRAIDDVAIQARVVGYLLTREFHEGDLVQAGDVLYTIESSEYRAALARAKADLSAAIAAQSNAERNYKRGLELLPRGAISQAEMDDLTAKKLDADANIEAARAQVTSAEVNLGFTTIKAPIDGRIGRSAASVGDLVGPTTGDLTTLVSVDPIEAQFQVSEATYVSQVSDPRNQGRDSEALRRLEVTVELANGAIYPEVGRVDYLSNRIDETTGTLEARARIPNPFSLLVPGQYVRVILRDTELVEDLFLPQAAVQADQQGSFVLVVDADGVVQRHNVELGERRDDKVIARKGVQAGERVIVRGLQAVRPGMAVQVRSVDDAQGA
ncbi:MAG: efflux transporter periplasmic adaptor subunit [Halioglobus sp.]|nr:efflux transporter periplasmic adaptor subunit [Halioglobus sp.]|tara:strand:+ start:1448 stop:2620 length:1173 start_codon:yes stop_codon:yes gene_type:complete